MFEHRIDDDIVLRPVEARYAEAIFALVDANREHLSPWMKWIDTSYSVDDTHAFIAASQHKWANNQGWDACIWYRGHLAGLVGHVAIDWTNSGTELGYWLGATFQGHGIITRACRAMIDSAFGDLSLHRVQIRCASHNQRSRAVPERLGFRQEGILRAALWRNNQVADMVIYGMLAPEWLRQLA